MLQTSYHLHFSEYTVIIQGHEVISHTRASKASMALIGKPVHTEPLIDHWALKHSLADTPYLPGEHDHTGSLIDQSHNTTLPTYTQ